MSSEGGIPALILYMLILWRAFVNVREAKRLIHEEGYPRLLAAALHASLASFAIGSFFQNVAYQFFPYFLFGYTTALLGIVSGAYTASPAKVIEMKFQAKPYEEAYGPRGNTARRSGLPEEVVAILRCPSCGGTLTEQEAGVYCSKCARLFPSREWRGRVCRR